MTANYRLCFFKNIYNKIPEQKNIQLLNKAFTFTPTQTKQITGNDLQHQNNKQLTSILISLKLTHILIFSFGF